jgi:plasmid stabilization system protein ParE
VGNSYRLATAAYRDLRSIRSSLTREASERIADRVEVRLFREFQEISRLPQMGHRHQSISNADLLVHIVWEYAILFRRSPEVLIVRVLHGRRDLTKLP